MVNIRSAFIYLCQSTKLRAHKMWRKDAIVKQDIVRQSCSVDRNQLQLAAWHE